MTTTRPSATRLVPLALLALGVAAPMARAQQVQGALSFAGGSATDQRGVHSTAATIVPSLLVVPDPRFSVGLSGSATRFQGDAWSAGGAATTALRLPLGGPLALAASAEYGATRTSFAATFVTAEAMPTLEATVRGLTLFGGARLARGESSQREATTSPAGPLGAPLAGARTVTAARSSTGPVYGASFALPIVRPDAAATLSYREERARVAGVSVVDRVAGASWSIGALALAASAGARAAPDESRQYGSVSATVALSRTLSLQGAAGSYPSSRVLGTLGGSFATLGLSLHGATAAADASRESVRGAPPVPAGATRLVLRAPHASRVEVAGEWNGWKTTPATRGADGLWYADLRLPRGQYRYAFRVDGDRWTVPEGAPAMDDGFGGRSALLTVR